MSCVLMLSTFPVTLETVVKFDPSALTWILKSRLFKWKSSPPAPACSTTKRPTLKVLPKSTCRKGSGAEEHHLSLGPASEVPLNALSGDCSGAQGALPVAARCSARFWKLG